MPRFNANEVDNYGGQGGTGYFSLKDDMDVATVRFMYNNIEDVEGYAVHQVDIDGRKRYVNCLRSYNEPVDTCPFCREGMFTTAKLFVPIYNEKDKQVQVWDRGKKFFAKMSSICSRYPGVVSHKFEIERHGKKGDTSTSYEIYEVGQDDTSLEDLPELPNILGGVVLDKTADDMEYYIQEGQFPPEDGDEVVRRRSSTREDAPFEEHRDSRRSDRRTPATSNRRDRF